METFLNYRRFRWAWINLLFTLALIIWFAFDNPVGGRRGSTVYGYTVGIISAAAIFYLVWYALRKRSHYSSQTTLKGCLAAHVWIGLFVGVWAALHANFSLHYNVHSFAYILLIGVIATGIWGAFLYRKLPIEIHSNRGGGSLKSILEGIERIQGEIATITPPQKRELLELSNQLRVSEPGLRVFRSVPPLEFDRFKAQSLLKHIPHEQFEDGIKLIGLIDKEYDEFYRLSKESRVAALLKVWLYFHVPLSIGLVAALVIHIISVFCYR